ncbi:MAG: anaerobic sulfatase maturase [Spirochaetes bacterium]|nr:anaerobic sulfatase maturase [Spirochaetota bacterium]
MAGKPLSNILVKPAGPDCNLACTYCFYHGKSTLFPGSGAHRMDLETLEVMTRQLLSGPVPQVSFSWQGGEPTLMGIDFFRRAVEYQERYGGGKTVGNGLQTNGILVDREWASLFRDYNFLVGLSIDGPEHVHDRYRRDPGGRGTWRRVMDTAALLLDSGVAVNALSVVNDYSARYPEETYRFLKGAGLTYMQFIPCVETGTGDVPGAAPFSADPEAYGEFLCRLFDLWTGDIHDGVPGTSIRFFESLLYGYAGLAPAECTLMTECGPYVVVEHNGDVYSCDFFVSPEWRLGNVGSAHLAELLNSPLQKTFGMMKSHLTAKCQGCPWLWICRGGCTKDRLRDPLDRGLNHFCGAFEAFFRHADGRLRDIIVEWKRRQGASGAAALPPQVGRNDPCPCGSGLKYKKCCGRGS